MTTWTTTLKVAPIFTFKRVADPAWHDREMYEATALRFRHNRTSAPLIVDHDPDCEIGTVTDLWRFESFDGPWVAATARLHEPPADWLKRGPAVSFGSKLYGRRAASFAGPEDQVITHAILEEVSVLIAQVPKEPLAEVVLVKREAEPVARSRIRAEPAAAHAGLADDDTPEWLRKAQYAAARKGNLIRFGGQVLRVR